MIDERTEFGARAARVTFHFDGDGGGGDIIVFTGTATVDPELPPADQSPSTSRSTTGTSLASG